SAVPLAPVLKTSRPYFFYLTVQHFKSIGFNAEFSGNNFEFSTAFFAFVNNYTKVANLSN
ncbi:MAG: hypothetical protein ACKO5Y_05425, partial [Bacteroidota bacterium]